MAKAAAGKRSTRSSRKSSSAKRASQPKRAKRAAAKKTGTKARSGPKTTARTSRGIRAARGARPTGGRVSKSLKYSKWIDSPADHEDRKGQSLATRSHEVIRQWAEERQAVPATVEGTEREDRAGVLRLNFPGYGEGNLKEISWDEWFETFDQRRLVFVFQEHKTDGATSNFFRLDNPEREDG